MEEVSVDANAEIPTTHCFVYKKNRYPFNYDLFKIFSQYFNSNQPPHEESIDLFDEDVNISESIIVDFINFCQARKITLTKDNATPLHKLSQKFKVPLLLNKTKEYIATHQKEVVIEILSMHQNDTDFQSAEYEEIISNDMINYIHDDRLLTLSLPIIHRILSRYLQKSQNQKSDQPPELIEFLFKCLDHFGRSASVLFDQIDTFGSSPTIIKRLLNGYSEKFDFHFVNTGNVKTIYDLENEIIVREKKIEQQENDEIKLMNKQRDDEVNDKKEMTSQFMQLVTQEIEKIRNQQDEVISNMMKKFEELQTQHKEEMQKQQEEARRQQEEMQRQHQEEMKKQREEFSANMKKISDQIEKLRPKINRLFSSDSIPMGIISALGSTVNILVPGYHPNNPVSYLRKFDNSEFYNYFNKEPKYESDSFIKFDFGQNKRIDLQSYFIRASSSFNPFYPKSWRIEGSNDDVSWTKLDQRSNDGSLNGSNRQCHFICQLGSYGSEDNLFRFIRYVQEDSWYSKNKYLVCLSYFELYGDVITVF